MEERQGGLEQPLLLHQLQTLAEPLLTSIRGANKHETPEFSKMVVRVVGSQSCGSAIFSQNTGR